MFNSQGVPHQQVESTCAFLSATQLKWLQETQNIIDSAILYYKGRAADDLTARLYKMQFGTNRCTWDWFIGCWDKVKAEAHELCMPEWVVPNVKAIWDAERNYHGKGMLCSSMITSLILSD
jgi:hypothetical protein